MAIASKKVNRVEKNRDYQEFEVEPEKFGSVRRASEKARLRYFIKEELEFFEETRKSQ